MILVADEGVDRQIVERLRRDGHEVTYVAELAPGLDDTAVLERAAEAGAVLVTADKDFGELVSRLGRANSGVLLIRLAGQSSTQKADTVATIVEEHDEALRGAFSVLSAGGVRIRRQP